MNGKWVQVKNGAWEDISSKLTAFTIDESECTDLCTLIWAGGKKLKSVMYTRNQVTLLITNPQKNIFNFLNSDPGTTLKTVKVEALCQVKGQTTSPNTGKFW